jgi:hypothetical protein
VRLAWNPIAYAADSGDYAVYLSQTSGGPYALAVATADKTASSAVVSGLQPSTSYFAVVRTTTNANPNNANAITSGNSAQVAFSTTSCGACSLSPAGLLIEGMSPYPPAPSEPNGVLEPGETATVSPVWTDTAAGAVTGVQATAGSLIGPNNGTAAYALPKGTAVYGDFSAGSTRSCGSNCYQVRVTADTRPASHWDANFTESLNSGETHTWTLHLGSSFADVATSSSFYPFVETIFHNGITAGFAPGVYGPGQPLLREQIAAFLARANLGAGNPPPSSGVVTGVGSYDCRKGGTSLYADVSPTDIFCPAIHWVTAKGLVFGCADGTTFQSTFCPLSETTRASMAVFIARNMTGGDSQVPSRLSNPATGLSYDCTDGQPNAFSDVSDTDPDCRYIYYIWSQEVVVGFGNGLYGPASSVTRDQMAKYLTSAFGLVLYSR